MKLHTRTKHEVAKYLCDQCKYQASWPANLKEHKNQNIFVISVSISQHRKTSLSDTENQNMKNKQGLS